ncbi:MAG: homoserine O-succinyltransferase [Parvularculaceae bacterium]|nr:homoserine O-succinyltransferase [Parvularculaceae bacterium]
MTIAARIAEAKAPAVDFTVPLGGGLSLESGERLDRAELRLRVHGALSDPVVAVAGGISAGRDIADAGASRGWWRDVVAPGGAIDLERFCVVGFDFLPNPQETARTISTDDQARAFGIALDRLGVARLHAFVGASYGGMVGLAFAARFRARVGRLCVISAAERPHPASTALRGVQRRIVEFASRCGKPAEGVSLARQLAMISYRTVDEFAARFDHRPGLRAGDPYPVCEYLIARGEAYHMPAARFVTLSDSIDRHAVDATEIAAAGLFIAVRDDRLVPSADIRRLADRANGRFVEIASEYGHDAFLKETGVVGPLIRDFIEEP